MISSDPHLTSNPCYSNDRMLLRRIALAESNDGQDEDSIKRGFQGGIWQVNRLKVILTLIVLCPNNKGFCKVS